MSTDTVISVESVSKKFCRSLKYTMLYGVRDVARDMFGTTQTSIGLRHDEFWALDDISFEVKRGECLGLIGPNGAGKSTLLKLLNGITFPDKGSVQLRGRVGALLELGAGFHPMLSGRENIYLSGAILGMSKEEIAEKLEAIVNFAGLEEFIDSPVKHYSSGMYVRLGFAVAVHAEPDVFLIDEALAVGDIAFQNKCYGKLREFREKGITIIFVTHSLDIVIAHCSRALLLDKGALIDDSMPKDVVDRYNRLVVMRGQAAAAESRDSIATPFERSSSNTVTWNRMFKLNPEEDRYGSKRAEILEAGIFTVDDVATQVLERNRNFYIKIKIRHNESMPVAIVAYSIKDPRGTILCGTNTLYQNVDMGQASSGTIVLVTFKQVARLNPGEYFLSVGCGMWEAGEYVVYDRRYDYMSFQIVGRYLRVGFFDPESEVEWQQWN